MSNNYNPRGLKYLVIHCTATPEGREVTAGEIRQWHTSPPPKGRGWSRVGYTDMIHLDGSLENLVDYNQDDKVDYNEMTWGVKGINGIARHIVYVGGVDKNGKPKDTRTEMQLKSLITYVKFMILRHPHIKIAGHNQFNRYKACPSFNVPEFLGRIGIPLKNIYIKGLD